MKNIRWFKVVAVFGLVLAMSVTSVFGNFAVTARADDDFGEQITESQEEEPEAVEPAAVEEAEQEKEISATDGSEQETEPVQAEDIPDEPGPVQEDKPEQAVRTTYVWNDGQIRVTAELSYADAIPDDAELIVRKVDRESGIYDYDAYMDALNSGSDSVYDENNTLLYDIAFIKDNVEIQPGSGNVSITFEFLDDQLAESIGAKKSSDVNVIHLPLTDAIKENCDTTADAKNIDAGDIIVEKLTAEDNDLQVSVANEKVTFETSGFSVFAYTVDFEYTDPNTGKVYTYNLEGAGSITLKELAVILGITTEAEADEFISNVEDVSFSDESLLKPSNTLQNGWVLESLQPFSSEELLTITMKDGTVIEVNVTDVQESTDLVNFLVNAVISGATQNADGKYEIEAGKDYSIILSFAESSTYQFANRSTLTYQMPEGITVIERQTGPLKVNIVYKGKTYQVDASFDLTTDGLLSIVFDQTDPDFPRLEESTNVSFRFTYHAKFEGSEDKIHFSDEIERDIVFDGPQPGQAYAEKSAVYDETAGVFHYTVTVTASEDVTEVNVEDVMYGDALIFNNDVRVSGNSSSYTDHGAANGFDYTFAEMKDGEMITITYSANVDFSKDDDKDGRITVDQTRNTVTVKPEDGDPHNSEYSREINFKYTVKKDGTEAGTTPEGDKIIDWEIEYNPLALVAVGGDKITDRISAASADYMKYYGSGITVTAYDRTGNQVYSKDVNYSDLTAYSDHTWTYTIPDEDTTPLYYVITYQTIVDMEKVDGGGVAVILDNTANNDEGTIHVAPEDAITVDKEAESFTTEEITWKATLSIPQNGLTKAEVIDYLPQMRFDEDGSHYMDLFKDGSLEITGLLPGESYTVDYDTIGQVKITFFKDEAHNAPGLLPYSGGRNVYVKLTTKVDQEWLQKAYDLGGRYQNHTNTISLNGIIDSATVTFGKPGIEKTAKTEDERSFKFTITIAGLNEEPFSIIDSFDTSLLEVDTSKTGDWEHMHIFGGTQWSQIDRGPVSYTDTETGMVITANAVPKQADGKFYPFYRIVYYLKLKDGVDLEQLAIANGGEYDLINTAKWGDHETDYTYKVKYDFLDKELLNAGELGGTDRTAYYTITFNSVKATLNGGEPMEMKDVLSDNLSLDYGSITITTDPADAEVSYSVSGGKDETGQPDGTTVATYIVPDSTKVVITYTAQVRGNGSQKIVNKVSVNGDDDTEESTHDYGAADEGEGAIASFKIVKVDGYDATKKLSGVKFKIFAENPNLDFGEKSGHAKEIELVTDENGEIILDGEDYDFYFDEVYHVQEIEAPEDYGTIGFDYLVTLTNKMAEVDYGQYIYYYSDSMQIKNWPLEGLVVEKQVESDDEADKDRYYTFRVSILNDDGSVNTDYNEKNGDDQFENGVVEFQIKDKEQKMFWGFLKGTKYRVEELDADGFATTVTYSIFDEEGTIIDTITEPGVSHEGELTQEDEVIIFKNSKHNETGSLKIKKNVTVNGKATTGTTADGTYTFTITGPDGYESEQTITITNGASNEIQIDGLVPGTYTVSEDTSKNPDGMSLVGENDIEVEVEAGEEAEVKTAEFTNNRTELGSLKIKKNVTVNGKATTGTTADGTYTFKVTGPDGYESEQTITITNGASNEIQIDDLVPGTYTVSEDTSKNPDGMSLVGENDIEVEVEAGEEAEVKTAEFTNNRTELGSLKIKKNVTVNGKATTGTTADGTYTFTITGPDGYESEQTITITNGASNEVQVDDLVPGTYTVSEDTSKNPDGMSLVGENDIEVEVEAGEEAEVKTAEFTNNRTETGSLKIKKNVTVNGKATTGTTADGTYTFTITGPDGYESEQTITITNGASNEVQVDDLVPGTYTVSEDTSKNPDGMSLVGENDIEVEVEAGEEAEVKTAEFTNDRTETGSLKIKKNVTVNGKATTGTTADGTYTFKITGPDGYESEQTITITNGESKEVQIDDLVPGTYTVSEDTSKNPDGMSLVGENDIEVEVEAGEEAEVKTAEFTNNRTETGSLKIKKNVTVNGKATTGTTADGTYTFTITGPDGYESEQTITITNGASNEVQVDGLVPGTYTVSEDTSKNPDGMSLVGENDIEVEVEAGEEAEIPTAEFTNNRTETGSLKIKKNVTVNGKATTGTTADGTYTFTITGPDGYESEQTITITNGASNEVQVDNLVPGKYTVSEDTSKNPNGMSLVGKNDIEVTVEANNIASIPTAEFTNNRTASGEGEIKVRKELKGRAWTEDDTFTFTISAPTGTPMPDQTSITITKKDADQTKSFGKIQFTEEGKYVYTVKETKGNIKNVVYDTKEHTVTIEVVDDGKGNLIAKEGTQLIQTVTITNTYSTETKTGDANNLFLYLGMTIASMLALLFLVIFRRKLKA